MGLKSVEAEDWINLATDAYDKALKHIRMLPPSKHDLLLENAGKSYAIKGEIYHKNDQSTLAKIYIKQALRLFERALEINPLYSKEIAIHRKKLHQLTNGVPS